jgi:hypothetical protein
VGVGQQQESSTVKGWKGAVPVLAVCAAGCRAVFGGGDDVCLTYAAPAITVEILDSASRTPVVGAGTLVIAREGAYADSVRTGPGDPATTPRPALAHERAGTYEVTVERDGFRPWRRAGVRVTRDECHVRTVALIALLQRLP